LFQALLTSLDRGKKIKRGKKKKKRLIETPPLLHSPLQHRLPLHTHISSERERGGEKDAGTNASRSNKRFIFSSHGHTSLPATACHAHYCLQ